MGREGLIEHVVHKLLRKNDQILGQIYLNTCLA